jgi:hypothetical protein
MAEDPVPEGFGDSVESAHEAFGRLILQLSQVEGNEEGVREAIVAVNQAINKIPQFSEVIKTFLSDVQKHIDTFVKAYERGLEYKDQPKHVKEIGSQVGGSLSLSDLKAKGMEIPKANIDAHVASSSRLLGVVQKIKAGTKAAAGAMDKFRERVKDAKKETAGAFKGLGAGVTNAVAKIGIALAALKKLYGLVKSMVAETHDLENSLVRIDRAMTLVYGSSKSSVSSIQKFAEELRYVTDQSRETISSLITLAVHLGINERQLKSATRAALGLKMATGMGENMAMRSIVLASRGQIDTRLTRQIPELRGETNPQVVFDKLMGIADKGFKRIEQEGSTFSRKMEDAGNVVNDSMAESMKPAAQILDGFFEEILENKSAVKAFTDVVGALVTGLSLMLGGLGHLTKWLSQGLSLTLGGRSGAAGLSGWDYLAHQVTPGAGSWEDRVNRELQRKQNDEWNDMLQSKLDEAVSLGEGAPEGKSKLIGGGADLWRSLATASAQYSEGDKRKKDEEKVKLLNTIAKNTAKGIDMLPRKRRGDGV